VAGVGASLDEPDILRRFSEDRGGNAYERAIRREHVNVDIIIYERDSNDVADCNFLRGTAPQASVFVLLY
jgi:hypothetical protein